MSNHNDYIVYHKTMAKLYIHYKIISYFKNIYVGTAVRCGMNSNEHYPRVNYNTVWYCEMQLYNICISQYA